MLLQFFVLKQVEPMLEEKKKKRKYGAQFKWRNAARFDPLLRRGRKKKEIALQDEKRCTED